MVTLSNTAALASMTKPANAPRLSASVFVTGLEATLAYGDFAGWPAYLKSVTLPQPGSPWRLSTGDVGTSSSRMGAVSGCCVCGQE
jgi:hypothetical protein